VRLDLHKDANTRYSVRCMGLDNEERLLDPPYPLNVIDRDFLLQAYSCLNTEDLNLVQ
jgi:hypothetical protein